MTYNTEQEKRDKNYKVRAIRVDDKIWKAFNEKRKAADLSWNLFLCQLLGIEKPYAKKTSNN